jgi:hypothetical protein
MARPKMLGGEKRTETVQARGTKVERERWEEVAWRRRTTISEMVRDFLNKEAVKELGAAPALDAAPKVAKKSPRKKASA